MNQLELSDFILRVHIGAALYMMGLIWFVQVVHYPLFQRISSGQFVAYESQHTLRTGWVVAPVMLVELGTGIYLAWLHLPTSQGLWIGLSVLLAINWLSTFLIQVPLHGRLSENPDRRAMQQLVWTNWIRTIAWTARGILLLSL